MTVPEFPSGDLLTAIDNDQVLIKKWTVWKDNCAKIRVLTSVCVAQISPYGTLELQPSLAPRHILLRIGLFHIRHFHETEHVNKFLNWSRRFKVAKENPEQRTKVIEACSPSETDKNVIRHENKQLIHGVLKEFLKEQTTTPGSGKDDVDLQVEEIEAKEGR
ncbi:hypothetical protein P5673_018571 [Acropora cervicornis]|uniref:Uncharacterized protein n=1 Tax=Acropora cervicornis TaxID=6130 RepID=A0AAD9V2N3_ACRCE|nr:hypothetical protein P5673_018571 [Acropora cervicornis]